MKLSFERIAPDADSSFHILLTPHLENVFLWHYHRTGDPARIRDRVH